MIGLGEFQLIQTTELGRFHYFPPKLSDCEPPWLFSHLRDPASRPDSTLAVVGADPTPPPLHEGLFFLRTNSGEKGTCGSDVSSTALGANMIAKQRATSMEALTTPRCTPDTEIVASQEHSPSCILLACAAARVFPSVTSS